MLLWARSAHARFSTKEFRPIAREGKYLTQELVHEALPMGLFAQRYFNADPAVMITHVLGNQNYDGHVEDRRPQPGAIRYLEVTTTLKTYEDSLRMEALSRDGHVAAYGPITAEGSRHNRRSITAPGIAVEHKVIREVHLGRVRQVVAQKLGKHYEPGTALIVPVDDFGPFSTPEDVAALDDFVSRTLLPQLRKTNFCLLALEGGAGLQLLYPIP